MQKAERHKAMRSVTVRGLELQGNELILQKASLLINQYKVVGPKPYSYKTLSRLYFYIYAHIHTHIHICNMNKEKESINLRVGGNGKGLEEETWEVLEGRKRWVSDIVLF